MTWSNEDRERYRSYQARISDARRDRTLAVRGIEAARTAGDNDLLHECEARRDEAADLIERYQDLSGSIMRRISGAGAAPAVSVLDDPGRVEWLAQAASSSMPIGDQMVGPVMSAEEYADMLNRGSWGHDRSGNIMAATGDVTIPSETSRSAFGGVIPQLRRRLTLLDLIPTQIMEVGAFNYLQESGSLDTAAETAEATVKPTGALTLTDAQVVAQTIPHFVKVPRQQLADVPSLTSVISDRLVYGVNRRLQAQIINGDGSGQNLRGILHTTGVAAVTFTGGDVLTDQILDGISDVLTSDADPNVVVINPATFNAIRKVKASGSGEYLYGDPATAVETLWSLPVVQSTAMATGSALVGDATQGATVYVREATNLRISDSDQDDFVKNRVTLLAEGRFGLAVWQPGAWATVALA